MSNLNQNDKDALLINLNVSVKRINRLLENLLEWAMLKQGKMTFTPKLINIQTMINDVRKLFNEQAKSKEIKILVNSEFNIAYADKNMVHTILRNLLSNSIKFTDKGGVISFSTGLYNENFIKVTVEDNGIGIPESMINDLFRIDKNTKRKGTAGEASTGLGLVLCKEFIEMNNGEIFVESDGKSRTRISFTLPTNQGQV